MSLNDELQADIDEIITALGAETITYNVNGGSSSDISASIEDLEDDIQELEQGKIRVRRRRVLISRTSTGISSPTPRDTITRDSETWAVAYVEQKDASSASLICTIESNEERARPGHRLDEGGYYGKR